MPTPFQILDDNDPSRDQIEVAQAIAAAVNGDDARDDLIEHIRQQHAWSAPLLQLASTLSLSLPGAGESVVASAQDAAWIDDLAAGLGRFTSVGLLSMGRGTTAVLSTAAHMGRLPAQLFTAKRAIRQAISFLDVAVHIHPPEQATALLLPGTARSDNVVHADRSHVETAEQAQLNGAVVTPVVHPLAHLSPEDAGRFRPADGTATFSL